MQKRVLGVQVGSAAVVAHGVLVQQRLQQVLVIGLLEYVLVQLRVHLVVRLMGLVHFGQKVLEQQSVVAGLRLVLVLNLVQKRLHVWMCIVLRSWSCHPILWHRIRLHVLLEQDLFQELIRHRLLLLVLWPLLLHQR